MRKLLIILGCVLMAACAAQRPKDASNYEQDLIYPKEAYPLAFEAKKVYDDPLGGVMLRYVDTKNPSDVISVYVYPIRRVSWDNREEVLKGEMENVLAEVDYMVSKGHYRSRGEEQETEFSFTADGREYVGRRGQFGLTFSDGRQFDSFAYLFVAEDKFIKFRTSFNIEDTPSWNGDNVVKALLPGIQVPAESMYMKKLREEEKARITNALIKMLMDAAQNQENPDESTDKAAE